MATRNNYVDREETQAMDTEPEKHTHERIPREPTLLITVDQAAHLLQVGRNRIYDLMATHEIEWLKMGESRRIVRVSIEDYIARHSTSHNLTVPAQQTTKDSSNRQGKKRTVVQRTTKTKSE